MAEAASSPGVLLPSPILLLTHCPAGPPCYPPFLPRLRGCCCCSAGTRGNEERSPYCKSCPPLTCTTLLGLMARWVGLVWVSCLLLSWAPQDSASLHQCLEKTLVYASGLDIEHCLQAPPSAGKRWGLRLAGAGASVKAGTEPPVSVKSHLANPGGRMNPSLFRESPCAAVVFLGCPCAPPLGLWLV